MSREINFRGISEKTGRWVYGCYITDGQDYHGIMAMVKVLGSDGEFITKTDGVIKETVGQLTDQADINGEEMYENDRLMCHRDVDWVVSFNGGSFVAHNPHDKSSFVYLHDYDFRVIGNIHQEGETK